MPALAGPAAGALALALWSAAIAGAAVPLLPPAGLPPAPPDPEGASDDGLRPAHRVDRAPRPFGSWLATAGLGLTAMAMRATFDGPEDSRWSGGVWPDDRVRDILRADDADHRRRADDLSDALLGSLWLWLAVDTVRIRDPAVELDTWRINLDAGLTTRLVESTVKPLAGRTRPDGSDHRSFFSGHAASAATAAGLLCAHHLRGDLYGGGRGDTAACAGAAALALGTGLARIAADKHYASDVVTAWGVGTVVGWVLPTRWYYERKGREGPVTVAFAPGLGGAARGVTVAMTW